MRENVRAMDQSSRFNIYMIEVSDQKNRNHEENFITGILEVNFLQLKKDLQSRIPEQ